VLALEPLIVAVCVAFMVTPVRAARLLASLDASGATGASVLTAVAARNIVQPMAIIAR